MVWQRTFSSMALQMLSQRQHPRAAARVGVEAHQLALAFRSGRIREFGKIFEVILADRMFNRHFRESVGVDESAHDKLQFANDGRGFELVSGSRVACHVGKKNSLATREPE